MYKIILVAIDLNDEVSCHKPLVSAIELARKFGARLNVLTVMREVEAIVQARASTIAYEVIASDLENRIAALIRQVNASRVVRHANCSVLVAREKGPIEPKK